MATMVAHEPMALMASTTRNAMTRRPGMTGTLGVPGRPPTRGIPRTPGEARRPRRPAILTAMAEPRMVFLGFGKYARADRIYALEPLRGEDRGDGRRTRVWIEGLAEPIVASRTERTILQDMGQD